MRAELKLVKIGKAEGEENNFHAPELCVVNIKLFLTMDGEEKMTNEFELETTGISDFRLINAQKYGLGQMESLIDWLNFELNLEGCSNNKQRVYKFVKEKLKLHKALNTEISIDI
jgi:hypothetical protein